MAISNTSILIKRSSTITNPGTLKAGELAYSYVSNTLYFGTVAGNGTFNVGGLYYTSTIDAATNANTASALVKRDANGAFAGNLLGHSSNTYALINAQNFSISGGDISATAQSFDGTSSVTLNASLNTVPGLTGGTYGSSTQVPVIGLSANGRITSITTASVSGGGGGSSSFVIANNTTSNTINSNAVFYHYGAGGITTAISANTVTIGTDNTIARTNTSSVGPQTFSTDINIPTNNMSVGGTLSVANLSVSGNIIQTNATQTLNVEDPMIYLAANNSGNSVDIGMVGHFVGSGHSGGPSIYQHTGFVRDYNDNKWKLFSNVVSEPSSTIVFDANTWYDVIKTGGLDASYGNITSVNELSANTISLLGALGFSSGGTGATGFTTGQLLTSNGSALVSLANTGTAGTYANANTIGVITTDAYGRINALTNTAIAILGQQITGGTVGVTVGGTGTGSFSAGGILIGNGTSALTTLANTSFAVTGTASNNSTVTSMTVDSYGRTTAITYTAISELTVAQGGTGVSAFTANGIIFGNGTGALQVTAAAGTADVNYTNQLLTVTGDGVPVWSTGLDAGSF